MRHRRYDVGSKDVNMCLLGDETKKGLPLPNPYAPCMEYLPTKLGHF